MNADRHSHSCPRPLVCPQAVLRHLCALLLLLAVLAQTASPAHAEPRYPPLTSHVVDAAGIIDLVTAAELDAALLAQEGKTSDQLVVATVPSLEGYPIEDYANGLFRAWKLGQSKENNGILLLIAPNERRVRIEVGYGLEGILTDAVASTIIRNAIIPEFQAGDMGQGALKGAQAIQDVLNMDPEEARARARALEAQQNQMTDEDVADIIIFLIFLAFIIFMIWRSNGSSGGPGIRGRGRRNAGAGGMISTWDWGSGRGGFGGRSGGGWSGGRGGSSGGGGASGSW